MTTVNAFGDVLGPRGRRRTLIASSIAVVLLVLLAGVAVQRFADQGQLDSDRWDELLSEQALRFLWVGMLNTLKVAFVAGALSMVIGTLLGLARLSTLRPVRWLATGYVQLFRALPSLLLISFSFFGINQILVQQGSTVRVSTGQAVVLGLTLYNSAVIAEIVRAGVRSLPRGQAEAAYALGMSRGQVQRAVLLPQAYLRMLPSLVSQLVTVLKDTAYGFVISYEELLRRGTIAGESTGDPLQALLLVAVGYIAVCFAVSRIARYLEKRVTRKYGGRVAVTAVEDVST